MVDTLHPVDSIANVPLFNGRMLRQVNAVAFAGATATRPLGGRSGVRSGTSATTVTATSTTWTCGPLAGVADVEAAAEAGLVTFALDAAATGAVTPASASFARSDLIYVQIDIPVEDGSAAPVVTRKYVAGPLVAGAPDPALPVSRAFAIARINMPIAGGGAPTVTWIAPYAVAAGGTLPVRTATERDAVVPVEPQQVYRFDTDWFEFYDGSVWQMLAGKLPYFLASRDKVPSLANTTDTVLESTFTWSGSPTVRGFTYAAGVVTILAAGVYDISAAFSFAANGTGARRLFVLKNGASTAANPILYDEVAGSASAVGILKVAGSVLLAAGDTLRVAVWQNSGAALAAYNSSGAQNAASSFFNVAAKGA
ncbi:MULTISPECIES: hypothetical protein [unclassified Cryobacterium]|uniref:hypothetical protein n=1 Tax=unclassified Cryobacterium TaxID=2649013 RepID=UPI002AB5269E|nr:MULTISPECIES: hypothetical protein [unclassified Cryobacterium]MDY7542596.1 hypothetical protein [Cryobacterium sp. 5B3]MEB0264716.1 hypothetical protein [Cryobacterium sp. 10I5]MEB0273688.1 hypothetical protein [Cryobacterium sp. 5B3]